MRLLKNEYLQNTVNTYHNKTALCILASIRLAEDELKVENE